MGCSFAYHLTRMGWTDVVVADKGELTSGATFQAAGPGRPAQGLGHFVKPDKGEFMGRRALVAQKEAGVTRRLTCLTIASGGSGPLSPLGKEAILDGDQVVGIVTSGGFDHTVGKPIAYGYLPVHYAEPGTRLRSEVAAVKVEATVETLPLYDPENRKVKG